MTVAELLNNLALKSGLDIENDLLKKVVTDTATINVPEEVAQKIESSLLTMEAAKNNPDLKKHFTAQSLNGIDATLKRTLQEEGYADDIIETIFKDKGTGKAVETALKEIKRLEAEKVGASRGDKAELTTQINALQAKIAQLTTESQSKLTEAEKAYSEKIRDFMLNSVLGSKEYALPVDKSANIITAKTLLSNELQAKNLQIVAEGETLKLVTNDGTDYYENSKKIDVSEIVDSVLAKNKLLKVTEAPGKPAPVVVSGASAAKGAEVFARHAAESENLFQ